MNAKQYRVIKTMMAHRGQWITSHDLAIALNLTWRQASALLTVLSPPLEIRRDERWGVVEARFNGTEEEMVEFEKQALKEIYGIDEDERRRILLTLSPSSWMSMVDLSDELGYKYSIILRVFRTLGDAVETKGTSVKMYRRNPTYDIHDNRRTPVSGHRLPR